MSETNHNDDRVHQVDSYLSSNATPCSPPQSLPQSQNVPQENITSARDVVHQDPIIPSYDDPLIPTIAAMRAASLEDQESPSPFVPSITIPGVRPTAMTTTGPSHNDQTSTTSIPVIMNVVQQERANFLLFIKILFRILEQAHEPQTKLKAQRIVVECRRRNQQGDPNYAPLMGALESRLRNFVGEANWSKAHLVLHHYMTSIKGKDDDRIRDGDTSTIQQRSMTVS